MSRESTNPDVLLARALLKVENLRAALEAQRRITAMYRARAEMLYIGARDPDYRFAVNGTAYRIVKADSGEVILNCRVVR